MLQLFEFSLAFPKGQHVHPSMGSIFHGALMEKFSPEVATAFHEKGMRPYSQAVFWDAQQRQARWHIGVLNEDVGTLIQQILSDGSQLYLRKKGYAVTLNTVTHQQYEAEYYLQPNSPLPKGADIQFLTTTSFKRSGAHVLFPEPGLLYQSIAQRWPLLSRVELERNIAEVLSYYTIIQDYDLHTDIFQLEGHGVKGFAGILRLRFGGNDFVRHMAAALLACGTFTGFGVKTALGMGAAYVHIL